MDEKQRQKIEQEAKQILDNFANALKKVEEEGKGIEQENVHREENWREEKQSEKKEDCESDSDFRKIIFENAPEKDKNFIKAEKKKW